MARPVVALDSTAAVDMLKVMPLVASMAAAVGSTVGAAMAAVTRVAVVTAVIAKSLPSKPSAAKHHWLRRFAFAVGL
jgi:hypothetical protein